MLAPSHVRWCCIQPQGYQRTRSNVSWCAGVFWRSANSTLTSFIAVRSPADRCDEPQQLAVSVLEINVEEKQLLQLTEGFHRMDMMDIYVSPDGEECETISTTVTEKCNPHKVVWLKCKAKAEKALHIVKSPAAKEEPPSPLPQRRTDNTTELQKTPLMSDQDTQHDSQPTQRENNPQMTSSTEPQFEHTMVHVETVEQLDMTDRDPTDMNKHVRVWFEEVLAEPEGMHSFDGVWRYSFTTFTFVKSWSYRVCTLLFGIPFSICWGVYFACLTFLHVWYVVPCIKSCLIVLHWASKLWTLCIRTFCDPCYDSVARIFSNMHFTSHRQ